MQCPTCPGDMNKGVIVGRSPGVKFKPNRNLAGDLGGVLLTDGMFSHRAEAYRCERCGTVVIPGRS